MNVYVLFNEFWWVRTVYVGVRGKASKWMWKSASASEKEAVRSSDCILGLPTAPIWLSLWAKLDFATPRSVCPMSGVALYIWCGYFLCSVFFPCYFLVFHNFFLSLVFHPLHFFIAQICIFRVTFCLLFFSYLFLWLLFCDTIAAPTVVGLCRFLALSGPFATILQ